ncbi:hypothetical protein D9M71_240890 [compost metagenome]
MGRVFHGVKVIEITEELVKAVHGGQKLVQVAQVVFAELAGGIAHGLEYGGNGDCLGRNTDWRAGLANGGHAGTDWQLAGDEVGASCRAAGFGIIVGEAHAFVGQGVEVGCSAGHHALVVDTDIGPADVVTHDDNNVGRLIGRLAQARCCSQWQQRHGRKHRCSYAVVHMSSVTLT